MDEMSGELPLQFCHNQDLACASTACSTRSIKEVLLSTPHHYVAAVIVPQEGVVTTFTRYFYTASGKSSKSMESSPLRALQAPERRLGLQSAKGNAPHAFAD